MNPRKVALFEAFQEVVLIRCKKIRIANLRLSGLNFRFVSNLKEGEPHLFLKLVLQKFQ